MQRKRRKKTMEIESEQQIRHECPKCKHVWFTVEVFVVEIDRGDIDISDYAPQRDESRD